MRRRSWRPCTLAEEALLLPLLLPALVPGLVQVPSLLCLHMEGVRAQDHRLVLTHAPQTSA